jgi:enoyl-CoA hydratase/carnithine racemase
MAGHVSIAADGDLAVVAIDRPPANALDPQLLEDGRNAVRELEALDPAAVVLHGRPGFFSAGLDLKVTPTLDEPGRRALVAGINQLFITWYGFPRPVVCAVNGHAIAGGFILALCGDWRVVGRSGKFGLTELQAGVPYPAAASAIVRAELPSDAARRLMLRADLTDAAGALAAGAFDEQVDDDQVIPRATEVAHELGALPSAAYARTKRDLRGTVLAELEARIEADADSLAVDWSTAEAESRATQLLG